MSFLDRRKGGLQALDGQAHGGLFVPPLVDVQEFLVLRVRLGNLAWPRGERECDIGFCGRLSWRDAAGAGPARVRDGAIDDGWPGSLAGSSLIMQACLWGYQHLGYVAELGIGPSRSYS
ncbi:hypothetical protein [Micromonospora sp. NPDC005173]|uniref:hypothetical protein n=1 Tax=Micromonospora sp. NPDC005173 TaxID=3157165 RepID=UPI0033B676E0